MWHCLDLCAGQAEKWSDNTQCGALSRRGFCTNWLRMRLIFLLLLLVNIALLFWRFALGLPDHYLSGADMPPSTKVAFQGRQLQLLGEPGLQTAQATSAPDVSPPLCKMVGPFDTEQAAAILRERLAVLDVSSQVRHVELSSGKGYWVHFPAEANRDAARRRLAQLQSRGIDSYMIPKGELKHGISLGVFSQKRSADAKVAELKALDYEPEVRVIDRSYEEIWVMLNEGEEQKIAKSAWKTLTQENFSLQEQENICLDVASR